MSNSLNVNYFKTMSVKAHAKSTKPFRLHAENQFIAMTLQNKSATTQ